MKIELDPRRWGWNTETGPAGFWIKTRGPFVWWGRWVSDGNDSERSRDDALV